MLCMSRIFFANGELNKSVFIWWTWRWVNIQVNFLNHHRIRPAGNSWSGRMCAPRQRTHTQAPGLRPPVPALSLTYTHSEIRARSREAAGQWLTSCFLSVETVTTPSVSGLSCSEISAAASWSEQKLQLVCTELQFLCPPPVWPALTLCFNISSTKICVTSY